MSPSSHVVHVSDPRVNGPIELCHIIELNFGVNKDCSGRLSLDPLALLCARIVMDDMLVDWFGRWSLAL